MAHSAPQSRGRLGKIVLVMAAVVAAVALILAEALDGSGSESTEPAFPAPSEEQAAALLAGLRRIDPALDHERSIGRARNVCVDLLGGDPREEIVERTRRRFTGSVEVSLADAERIVRLVERGGWCVT